MSEFMAEQRAPIHLEIGARCFYGTAKRLARRTGTNSELSREIRLIIGSYAEVRNAAGKKPLFTASPAPPTSARYRTRRRLSRDNSVSVPESPSRRDAWGTTRDLRHALPPTMSAVAGQLGLRAGIRLLAHPRTTRTRPRRHRRAHPPTPSPQKPRQMTGMAKLALQEATPMRFRFRTARGSRS